MNLPARRGLAARGATPAWSVTAMPLPSAGLRGIDLRWLPQTFVGSMLHNGLGTERAPAPSWSHLLQVGSGGYYVAVLGSTRGTGCISVGLEHALVGVASLVPLAKAFSFFALPL